MTTFQLANILARRTRFGTLLESDAGTRYDILLAINAALQEVYAKLPGIHRTTTVSHTLRAPELVEMTFQAQYSNFTTASVFSTAQIGCTILITGDPDYNEVVAANAVLDEFVGSEVDTEGMLYYDAIPVHAVLERITTPVSVFRAGQKVTELQRWEESFDRLSKGPGIPERYRIVPMGSSQGASPEFLIRVWPLPADVYKVRFDAEVSTVRVTFEQISQSPANLPISEHLAESALVPIALGHFTRSVSWADPSTKSKLSDTSAALEILSLVPMDIAPGANQLGTPSGF